MSLRDQLQAIYDQHARLTPALVVDTARSPDHPLHDRFEWDDSIAGESWRKYQAHELIRTVTIVRKSADGETEGPKVRAFHAVRGQDGYVYEPVERVIADPFLTKLVLADMEREWKTLRSRYEKFNEFWNLVRDDVESLKLAS